MSMPSSWADLDWTKATPLDHRYIYSLWAAVAERRHVVRRPDAGVNTFLKRRHFGQHPSREEFVALRDAIYAICDRFIRLDVDYSDDDWASWPVLWTPATLIDSDARAIALMPDAADDARAWGDWMRRAKACLDVLVASRSPTWWDYPGGGTARVKDALWAEKNRQGTAVKFTYTDLDSAIAAAVADEEIVDINYPRSVELFWSYTRWRYGNFPPPPDYIENYTAGFDQDYQWKMFNPSSICALGTMVARRRFDSEVFDGFCYFTAGDDQIDLFSLGENPAYATYYDEEEKPHLRRHMLPGEVSEIFPGATPILYPSAGAPTLAEPSIGGSTTVVLSCEVLTYFDYRVAGGFKFYTPEEI